MIDIRFLRENPEVVKENIRKKFQDEKLPLVDEVIALDAERRATQQQVDDLKANRNKTRSQKAPPSFPNPKPFPPVTAAISAADKFPSLIAIIFSPFINKIIDASVNLT